MDMRSKVSQRLHAIADFVNRCVMKIRHEALVVDVRWSKISAIEGFDGGDRRPIVVSLTSFPARFCDMDLCLKSLFRQTVKPDHIVLWLGSDSLDSDYRTFSKSIRI